MAELVWSLNGKFFKDFGIYISSSNGLLGELKPKKQESKDWPEYNGLMLDLTKSNLYESRQFDLTGWVIGENWLDMLSNFIEVFGELRKPGKQRLLLDVFGEKTLVFDVRTENEIELKKDFRNNTMVGTFNVKLIEHNPIKKILFTDKNRLLLNFNTTKWVEVNIDGVIQNHKGEVAIDKLMSSRSIGKYNFFGRNYIKNFCFKNGLDYWSKAGSNVSTDVTSGDKILVETFSQGGIFQAVNFNNYTGKIIVSFEFKPLFLLSYNFVFGLENLGVKNITVHNNGQVWVKYEAVYNVQNYSGGSCVFYSNSNNQMKYYLKNIQVTTWENSNINPAPEDQHYISIAGNIDEITNLTSNAEILWERL